MHCQTFLCCIVRYTASLIAYVKQASRNRLWINSHLPLTKIASAYVSILPNIYDSTACQKPYHDGDSDLGNAEEAEAVQHEVLTSHCHLILCSLHGSISRPFLKPDAIPISGHAIVGRARG